MVRAARRYSSPGLPPTRDPSTVVRSSCPGAGRFSTSRRVPGARPGVDAITVPDESTTWSWDRSCPVGMITAVSWPWTVRVVTWSSRRSREASTSDDRARCRSVLAMTAAAMRAAARMSVAPSVTRARTLSRASGLGTRRDPVAGAAHGLDQVGTQLAAQCGDVDLDDVVVALEGEVPDVSEDVGLGDHLAVAPQEVLDDGELPRRQVDRLAVERAPTGPDVETQRAGRQHRRTGTGAP